MSETTLEGKVPRRLLIRAGIGLLAGFIVALLAIVVAWRQTRDADGLNWDHRMSKHYMEVLQSDVDSYQKQFGALPESLLALTNISWAPNDAWGRPYSYSTQGTNYVIAYMGATENREGRGPIPI